MWAQGHTFVFFFFNYKENENWFYKIWDLNWITKRNNDNMA